MNTDEKQILETLVRESYITQEVAKQAISYAEKNHASPLSYLLSNGLITKNLVGQSIAESFDIEYIDLDRLHLTAETIQTLPEDLARKYHVIFVKNDAGTAHVATDNPGNPELITQLQQALATTRLDPPLTKIQLAYSYTEDILSAFVLYRKSFNVRFIELINSEQKVAPQIITQIIEDALAGHASDIHFEPQETEVVIRFRIDGVLLEVGRIEKEYYENILNRIKVLAHLRIDEHFAVQDGAIRLVINANSLDLRVSISPTIDGEKIVIRLLASYVETLTFESLGLSDTNLAMLKQATAKPFGMILVTGPTGSGKTTTLYTVLKSLAKSDVNITTIEDPVEYKIPGVNHIQVNPEKNITFAQGLRSIVRQDPDIILVGEIRDFETVDIATNAALTGHLLLTTFHANDAIATIPRLLTMGAEPFILASTLELIVSQRLVRRICDQCRTSQEISLKDLDERFSDAKKHFTGKTIRVYNGKGCDICNGTGYKGRIALYELLHVTPEMEELILSSPSNKQIEKLSRAQGSVSLFTDGIEKVKLGTTTLEELFRVATPPSAS